MNQDEINKLAIECGAIAEVRSFLTDGETGFLFIQEELVAYTAAVEARERERIAVMADHILKEGGGTYGDAIRELK